MPSTSSWATEDTTSASRAGRIFPIRFLCRHYPIRSQAHGARKVVRERKGRFAADEIAMGWHRQYEHVREGHVFLSNPASLRPFNEETRLETLLEGFAAENASGRERSRVAPESGAAPRYEGFLDRVDGQHIFGWARSCEEEGDPVEVEVWDGGRLIASVTADVARPDLQTAGKDGGAGFVLPTPTASWTGEPTGSGPRSPEQPLRSRDPRFSSTPDTKPSRSRRRAPSNRNEIRPKCPPFRQRKDPEVSVVIPCFNLGAYLDEAVQSVLDQTYQDFEIVIVDDGSDDPVTRHLLASYRRPRTRVVLAENGGIARARNRGLAEAAGHSSLSSTRTTS